MNFQESAVSRVIARQVGLEKYCEIMKMFNESSSISSDKGFQTAFTGYYKVRNDGTWRRFFIHILIHKKIIR